MSPDLSLFLDSILPAALDRFQVPGVSVAVVQADQVTLARGYGARTLAQPGPVDEHSLFGIASISKTFTAVALAMLVDEGRLAWDDRVSRYLPDFRLTDDFASREITVRDLLCHRCGLREVSGGTIWYASDLSRAEVVRRLRFLPVQSSFRSSFAYQNVTFLVAGEVLRAVTGQTWDEFVTTRIFTPLGMTRSTTSIPALETRANIATPHARIHGQVQPVPIRSHDNVGPAASINTSACELAQYARLHLNSGEFAGERLLSAERYADLWSPHTPIPIGAVEPAFAPWQPTWMAYGLGWYLRQVNGRRLVSHSGGVDGYRTLLTLVPEERLGVIVLSNSETSITHAITHQILAAMWGSPAGDWVNVYATASADWFAETSRRQAEKDNNRVLATQPSLPLAAYAGRYASPLVEWVEVTPTADGLTLRFAHTPGFTADLSHWHYNTFRLNWRDPYIPPGRVTFQLDSAGQAAALEFDQPNLLDVDFSELGLLKKLPPEAA
jgi:CubicO group peptidase (beta-lactamase class C family)